MEYVIYEDEAGEWRWRTVTKNNRITSDSAEGYASKSNAKRAVMKNRHDAYSADIVYEGEK